MLYFNTFIVEMWYSGVPHEIIYKVEQMDDAHIVKKVLDHNCFLLN